MPDTNSNSDDDIIVKKPKERGLGRGLDALFGDDEDEHLPSQDDTDSHTSPNKQLIGIEKLFPCPDQPRKHFDPTAIDELAASLQKHGMIQPILVRPDPRGSDMYEIIAGERRWRAAQRAQIHEVPIIIRDLDDTTMFQIALVENLQRRDLDPMEEAQGYQRLIEEFDHTAEDVGKAVGKSRSHITNMTRLLSLPQSVKEMVSNGQLTMGHARALITADQPALLATQIVNQQLSVRNTEKLINFLKMREANGLSSKITPGNKKTGFHAKDADTLALEKEVSDTLGMAVTIDMKKDQKGKMTISFSSLDQLDDVLQRLTQRQ